MSFSQWEIDKKADHEIIDQQDDMGMGWEKIASFWPEDMPEPDIGIKADESECCTIISDGMQKEAKYPMKTPEDALASSMYLVAFGVDSLDKEAAVDIAERLQKARQAHSVELPDRFTEFAKTASFFEEDPMEVYADNDKNFPITTEQQTSESIHVFQKHASRLDSKERAKVASRLKEAAEKHGVDEEVPYSRGEISKTASQELQKRQDIVETVNDEEYEDAPVSKSEYLAKVAFMQNKIENPAYDLDRDDIYEMTEYLEELDKQAGMDVIWDQSIENPASTFFDAYNPDIYGMDKEARTQETIEDLSDVKPSDLEGLEEKLDEDVVSEIKRDPKTIIPSLPDPHKDIIRDHVNSNE